MSRTDLVLGVLPNGVLKEDDLSLSITVGQ
jgi:hypothetical protein